MPPRKPRRPRGVRRVKRRPPPRPRKKPKPPLPAPAPPAVQVREKGRPADNTTCDVYHAGNPPPGVPDVQGVACHLSARWQQGAESSEGDQAFRWTHLLTCDTGTDIRDTWPDAPDSAVMVPDTATGTTFQIVFVELVNRGTPAAYKRVFLNRQDPTWPTSQL